MRRPFSGAPEHENLQHYINQYIYTTGQSVNLQLAQSQLNQSIEDHQMGNHRRAHQGLVSAAKFLKSHVKETGPDRVTTPIWEDAEGLAMSYKHAYEL